MVGQNAHLNMSSIKGSYALSSDQVEFILHALQQGDEARVLNHVSKMHAADITELLTVITQAQRVSFLSVIGDDLAPEVLIDLEGEIKEQVLEMLGAQQSADAISQLEYDDAMQVMEDLQLAAQEEILEAIPQDQRTELEIGLSYPNDSAGRLMDTNYVAAPASWTVGKTIDYLRSAEDLPDTFYSLYVLDRQNRPIGSLLVSQAIRSARDVKIKSLLEKKLYTISHLMDQEEVAYIFRKYALASAPVIDSDGRIVGVITVDDVVDVIEEEAEEDILHLGGVGEIDVSSAYLETAKGRFPWLFINLLTAIAASGVIALFAESIEQLVALAVLMPVVASMAGNAGTQTMTVAVRALATKELTDTNARRVVRKEILAAAVNGLLFALIVAGVCYGFYGDAYLSGVIGISMFCALILAAFSGALIPLCLVRAGVDPAISSSVFLTTVTDISAFFIFLGLASLWLL
jgi:magnesium transporter